MNSKKVLVIGASPNPDRYSHKAVRLLKKFGHQVEAIGIKNGTIDNVEIQKGTPLIEDIDTISLYIGPARQPSYFDYILSLNPKRIIFNPGTENPGFEDKAIDSGIEVVDDCTLVMLNSGQF
jgi:predicted CoA-binding protein